MKTFRKVIGYFVLAVAVLLIALVVSVFLFKDQVINQFIKQANRQLNTPITIGKMNVSVFEQFPKLSIVFHTVYVEDSHEGQYPLLTASRISFQLNPIEVYQGVYNVLGLTVTDCEVNLKINNKGVNNYTIIKENSSEQSVGFSLRNVHVTNCRVRYLDLERKDDLVFYTNSLNATINSEHNRYHIDAAGSITTEQLQIGSLSLMEDKQFDVSAHLLYDDSEKKLAIQPSEMKLDKSLFSLQGSYQWKDGNQINLSATGKNTTLQTLLSLFPEKTTERFREYQSTGDAYFNAQLNGEIGSKKSPSLRVDFGLNNAQIKHPQYNTSIEEASMSGTLTMPALHNLKSSTISIKNINGKLQDKAFRSDLEIRNLNDPEITFGFIGEIDVTSLFNFYPIKSISQPAGTLVADVSFEGKTSWLKNKSTAQQASALGTIDLKNLSFLYGTEHVPVNNLSGTLQFNKNDLALSNVEGKLGGSDFLLNGFFKNVITWLLFENQPVSIEADLHANFLDVDELFELGFGKPSESTTKSEYEFGISKNLNLKFNCEIARLTYKRFKATNLKGDLLVANQRALSRNIALNGLGGRLVFTGSIDATNPKANALACAFLLNGIHVDSAFYVFENFRQDFLLDKNLKGQADAEVMMDVVLNQNLRMFPETLVADISATIRKGELNQFEPLKKLERYLDDQELNAIRFADLKNEIHIEKKTIYIPQMEVKTNVSVMQISGTHRFDQQIDYRIVTPLNNKRKINLAEATGAIEEMEGRSKLFLKITGTTDDYRVQYDTEAVKRKIAADLKKEVQELKDLFKKKQKKKEAELSKEEFEW
ncbi:MAG: AsmA-like C-terminal region-containing protein [Cyclobacteriaceae bacterium]|nr:AsmA-like C-terminal region-containing protein [Cyclobacteriaceae bacterium]